MPKKVIAYIILAELVLILAHLALYESLIFFFPAMHGPVLATILAILSVSFLASTLLSFRYDNIVSRMVYRIAAAWLPTAFYLFISQFLALLVYLTGLALNFHISHYALVLTLLALLFSAYGLINARMLRTVKLHLSLPNLPDNWKGKSIVVLSDLHLGHVLRDGFTAGIVKKINALNPEMVLIVGDLFDGVETDFDLLLRPFKELRALEHTYFVSGNHEKILPEDITVKPIIKSGIKIIDDQIVELDGLQLIGIGYKGLRSYLKRGGIDGYRQTVQSLSIDKNKPSILLKHVPDHLEVPAELGISVQFSGHTHHGQVYPFRYITRRMFKGHDYGYSKFGNLQVFTSSGAGTWGPPMRTFTKSEIVHVILE